MATMASGAAVRSVEAAWIQLSASLAVVFGHMAVCTPVCSAASLEQNLHRRLRVA